MRWWAMLGLGGALAAGPLTAQLPLPEEVPGAIIGKQGAVFRLPLLADTVAQRHPGWRVTWGDETGVWVQDTTLTDDRPLAARVRGLMRRGMHTEVYQGERFVMLEYEDALRAEVVEGTMVLRLGRSKKLTQLLRARPDSLRVVLVDRPTADTYRDVQVTWVRWPGP